MAAVLPLGSLRASVSAGVDVTRGAVAWKASSERLRCHDGLRASVFAYAETQTTFPGYGSKKVAGKKLSVSAVLGILQKVVDSSGRRREALVEMCEVVSSTRAFRNVSVVAMNVLLAMPALAEEEKGKIFDFNLTLPIIAVQFLLLMVALDNIWFKPVARVMDERDANIRAKLIGVRDNSGEIKRLTDEAEALIKAARVETTLALNKTKRETAAELEAKLAESRARIEKELAQALANLQEKKEETLRSLDTQVAALSDEILRKVIPFKI